MCTTATLYDDLYGAWSESNKLKGCLLAKRIRKAIAQMQFLTLCFVSNFLLVSVGVVRNKYRQYKRFWSFFWKRKDLKALEALC